MMNQYEQAADILGETFKLAKIDMIQNWSTANKYQVKRFPTLKLFKNTKPFDYDGGKTSQKMVDYLMKQLDPNYLAD